MLLDGLLDVDEFADDEVLALAPPLASTFALGETELAEPLAVDSAPFAVDSVLDTAPFALDVALPAALVVPFVRLDVSALPLAEPLALSGPAFVPVEPEAEPDPFAIPVA